VGGENRASCAHKKPFDPSRCFPPEARITPTSCHGIGPEALAGRRSPESSFGRVVPHGEHAEGSSARGPLARVGGIEARLRIKITAIESVEPLPRKLHQVGGRGLLGAHRRPASWPATSSRSTPRSCAAIMCSSSSSLPPGVSTSLAAAHIPAGAQPQLLGSARRREVPDPRPRLKVRRRLRRGLPRRRHQGDPDSASGTQGKRVRRALRPHRPSRVPRLATDPRTTPARPGSTCLRRSLQPPAPAPCAGPLSAGPPRTSTTTHNRNRQTTRSLRRRVPRVLPGRSMSATGFWHPTGRGFLSAQGGARRSW
jgi:hypothetical protein